MRSPRDEPLLVGDLVFRVDRLFGLTRPDDLYVVVEIDSYGHYFRKAKTKIISQSIEPAWNEEFMIELEGSENLRILVYEVVTPPTEGRESVAQASSILRGRATLELSRTWLTKEMAEQRISMNDVVLSCSMKFLTFEDTMRRVPTTKATGMFVIIYLQKQIYIKTNDELCLKRIFNFSLFFRLIWNSNCGHLS